MKTSGKQTLLRGLATVNFYAADIKAAKKWYSELLGSEPYFAHPDLEITNTNLASLTASTRPRGRQQPVQEVRLYTGTSITCQQHLKS